MLAPPVSRHFLAPAQLGQMQAFSSSGAETVGSPQLPSPAWGHLLAGLPPHWHTLCPAWLSLY